MRKAPGGVRSRIKADSSGKLDTTRLQQHHAQRLKRFYCGVGSPSRGCLVPGMLRNFRGMAPHS
jgi:hypothetical protein